MKRRTFTTRMHIKILILVITIGMLYSCEKDEQYATATINGIEYAEIRTSNILFEAPPSSITIWEDASVAGYYTKLEPLTSGYPVFAIDFYLSLKNSKELKIDQSYKIANVQLPDEFNLINIITSLEKMLPSGSDGIAFCQKEGIDEVFSLDGEFKIERYDATSGYYYGSYHLTHLSQKHDTLTIKGKFKIIERRYPLIY